MSSISTLPIVLAATILMVTPLCAQHRSVASRPVAPLFAPGKMPTATWLSAGATEQDSYSSSPQMCRIDACEAPAGWDDATSATVRISTGCTGVLVNNTNQDHTPYILTAYHCGQPTVGETIDWTFYFNDQVADCSNPQPPTSTDTMQGAVVRAAQGGYHDYVLLELLEPIPAAYNISLAGWSIADAGSTSPGTRPTSGMVIGHPQSDLKKMTMDDDPIDHYGPTHWVGQFDHGTVEVGSSGSPLFNESHQVVGLVRAALQIKDTCSGPDGDDNEAVILFPKLSYNWNAGAEGERLSDFLDPASTGASDLGPLGPPDPSPPPPAIWINEVNAFGKGRQRDEYIEIMGPAGTRLTDYQIDIYACSKGSATLQSTQTIGAVTLADDDQGYGFYVLGGSFRKVPYIDQRWRGGSNRLPDGTGLIVLKDRLGEDVFDYQYGDAGDASACPNGRTTRSPGDIAGQESMGFPVNTVPSSTTAAVIFSAGTPGAPNAKGGDLMSKAEASLEAPVEMSLALPDEFLLSEPYPNPFNPQTTFSLAVPVAQEISVEVYNLLGRRVAVLHQGTIQAKQAQSFVWQATSHPSGMYFIRIVGEQFTETRRVTLIK